MSWFDEPHPCSCYCALCCQRQGKKQRDGVRYGFVWVERGQTLADYFRRFP